jgi:ubiquitin carboxyl-terminal hydrolase 12/46
MGSGESKSDVGNLPADGAVKPTRGVGLENYGNSCYLNSVVQLLFHCTPLRLRALEIYTSESHQKPQEDSTLFRFCELVFLLITHKKKKNFLGPSAFIQRIRRSNPMFDNLQQQDAQEFAMYVVNEMIEEERALLKLSPTELTPIQQIFQGEFSSETSCLECETKTVRRETFLDLSVDIEQNCSLSQCIENFSSPEYLTGHDKFHCDACCAHVCARRSLRISTAPPSALLVHLKRFKYVEERQAFKKLAWHVAIPSKLPITVVGNNGSESLVQLQLAGIVVHQGAGPTLGHYISCIRSGSVWRKFDDDEVTEISERDIQQYFGLPFSMETGVTSTAYILLYERRPAA